MYLEMNSGSMTWGGAFLTPKSNQNIIVCYHQKGDIVRLIYFNDLFNYVLIYLEEKNRIKIYFDDLFEREK